MFFSHLHNIANISEDKTRAEYSEHSTSGGNQDSSTMMNYYNMVSPTENAYEPSKMSIKKGGHQVIKQVQSNDDESTMNGTEFMEFVNKGGNNDSSDKSSSTNDNAALEAFERDLDNLQISKGGATGVTGVTGVDNSTDSTSSIGVQNINTLGHSAYNGNHMPSRKYLPVKQKNRLRLRVPQKNTMRNSHLDDDMTTDVQGYMDRLNQNNIAVPQRGGMTRDFAMELVSDYNTYQGKYKRYLKFNAKDLIGEIEKIKMGVDKSYLSKIETINKENNKIADEIKQLRTKTLKIGKIPQFVKFIENKIDDLKKTQLAFPIKNSSDVWGDVTEFNKNSKILNRDITQKKNLYEKLKNRYIDIFTKKIFSDEKERKELEEVLDRFKPVLGDGSLIPTIEEFSNGYNEIYDKFINLFTNCKQEITKDNVLIQKNIDQQNADITALNTNLATEQNNLSNLKKNDITLKPDLQTYITNNTKDIASYFAYEYLNDYYERADNNVKSTPEKLETLVKTDDIEAYKTAVNTYKSTSSKRSFDATLYEKKEHYASPLLINGINSIMTQLKDFVNDINTGVYSKPIINPFGFQWASYYQTLDIGNKKLYHDTLKHQKFVGTLKTAFETATNTPFGTEIVEKFKSLNKHLIALANAKLKAEGVDGEIKKKIKENIKKLETLNDTFNTYVKTDYGVEKINQAFAAVLINSDLPMVKKGGNEQRKRFAETRKGGDGLRKGVDDLNLIYDKMNRTKDEHLVRFKTAVKDYERVFEELKR